MCRPVLCSFMSCPLLRSRAVTSVSDLRVDYVSKQKETHPVIALLDGFLGASRKEESLISRGAITDGISLCYVKNISPL